MSNIYPSFLELKTFISEHPESTICEIRDKFNQKGDDIILKPKPGCIEKNLVLAYDIKADFFRYLQTFIKEKYVECKPSAMACRISDDAPYDGPDEFIPIVLSIKKYSLFDFYMN